MVFNKNKTIFVLTRIENIYVKNQNNYCFINFIVFGFSQKLNLSGIVTDSDKIPVHNAVVALLTPIDSILYKFVRSNKEGKFEIKNLKTGKFILMTSHSQYADYVDEILVDENQIKIENIALISKSKLLQEVIIKTGSKK